MSAANTAADGSLYDGPALGERELAAIIRLVYDKSGITLHEGKRALVTSRLQRRLRAVGARTFADYLAVLQADATGAETSAFLDAITTNHTSFFREPQHFDLLTAHVLPDWLARSSQRGLDVWSAACATGEEPYTLAMTLAHTLPAALWQQTRILASDISTTALRAAASGVFKCERLRQLPLEMLRRSFDKGIGAQEGLARVKPELRAHVEFRRLNLLEISDLGRRFPVIFCRNVMIYFDRQIQQRVVTMLERHLEPGGYLFIAHSESLNGIAHGLHWVAPAVYQRRAV